MPTRPPFFNLIRQGRGDCVTAWPLLRVQAETMKFGRLWADYEVCPHAPAATVERRSDVRHGVEPYGLLVRVWPAAGPEPAFFRGPVDRDPP